MVAATPRTRPKRLPPVDFGDLPAYVRFELDWYTRAAARAHFGYLLCEGIALVAAAAVPLTVYLDWKFISAALGAIAATAGGIGLLGAFKSNYMTRGHALEELRATIACSRAAGDDDAELVSKVSAIVLSETSQWRSAIGNLQAPAAGADGRDAVA